jgi:integrase
MSDALWAHMRRWRKLSARFLIEHNGAPVADVTEAFETACELAGLARAAGDPQRITPHVLRHTCCSWMLQEGLSEWKVGEYVGMTVALVASTYGHISDDVQRATANAIGRRAKNVPQMSRRCPADQRDRTRTNVNEHVRKWRKINDRAGTDPCK